MRHLLWKVSGRGACSLVFLCCVRLVGILGRRVRGRLFNGQPIQTGLDRGNGGERIAVRAVGLLIESALPFFFLFLQTGKLLAALLALVGRSAHAVLLSARRAYPRRG